MNIAPTIIRRAPTIYVESMAGEPMTTDDLGNLVETDYGVVSVFLNDQFNSIPAAMEYYGVAQAPIPALI